MTRKPHPVWDSNSDFVFLRKMRWPLCHFFFFRASWAGGERGLTLTRQLLAQLPNLLTKKGFALVSWTKPTFANHIYCFHPMVFMCGGGCLGKVLSLKPVCQYFGALHFSSTILQYLAVNNFYVCLTKALLSHLFKSSFTRPGTDSFNCTVPWSPWHIFKFIVINFFHTFCQWRKLSWVVIIFLNLKKCSICKSLVI
jgi:hypothetical protein